MTASDSGMPRRRQRGSSVLECAASLALASLLLAASARAGQASTTMVRHAQLLADTVDVARNLLEHELGAPCAAPFDCPAGYHCEVSRWPVTAAADRITAVAVRDDGLASQQFHTLAPTPACGG